MEGTFARMTQISVETEIHDAMQTLTAAEKRAARALLSNYPTLGLAPVAEFALASGASAATVLRFVAQLGFDSYPDFQRRLREELEERIKTPLQKASIPARKGTADKFLGGFIDRTVENLRETAARLPASEFEAVCARLADARGGCHIAGGRFTDAIAAYLTAHLRIVRPGVRKLEERPASGADQLLDVKAGDTAVIFDIRRYDDQLLRLATALKARRARIILITDSWISPVSRHAKYVLPCTVEMGRTWDSNTTLFAVAEAVIARVTELSWATARERIAAKEAIEK
jgi:DNA-binding MurR/RpiR family transcriptional regulator